MDQVQSREANQGFLRGIPSAWKAAVLVFLGMRLLLSVWMWGVRQVFDQPVDPHPVLRPYFGVAVEQNPWLEPWQRWDVLHYQAIVEGGYQAFDGAVFTPPLFPLLSRALTELSGMGSLPAGMLVSNLAFAAALAGFYQLVERETGQPETARRTLLYLASFPTAFFFLAGYSESLFLLAAVLSIDHARRKNWILGGAWGAAAALTRLTGALVILPLGFAAWQNWRESRSFKPWLAPLLTGGGTVLFPLYVWLGLGMEPWAPLAAQVGRFQGSFTLPGTNLFLALRGIITRQAVLADWMDAGFLLLFLVLTLVMLGKLPAIYAVYQGAYLLLLLTRISSMQPLLGTARYVLALFPGFIVLSLWGKNPWWNRIYLYTAWFLLLLLAGQFAIWGWVG